MASLRKLKAAIARRARKSRQAKPLQQPRAVIDSFEQAYSSMIRVYAAADAARVIEHYRSGDKMSVGAYIKRRLSSVSQDMLSTVSLTRIAADRINVNHSEQFGRQMRALLGTNPLSTARRLDASDELVIKYTAEQQAAVEKALRSRTTKFLRETKRYADKTYRTYLRDIQAVAFEHFAKGADTGTLAEALQERLAVSTSKARLVARDQSGKYFSALTETKHRAIGVTKYTWLTAGDERVRDEHADRDGKTYTYDDPPSDGNPGEPISCRCVAAPVFDDE